MGPNGVRVFYYRNAFGCGEGESDVLSWACVFSRSRGEHERSVSLGKLQPSKVRV